MIEYPKTRNLNKRDGATMLEDTYQLPEAIAVSHWQAHEKIDGTNCRLDFRIVNETPVINFGGRTANARLHKDLFALLDATTIEGAGPIFDKTEEHGLNSITVFAEGIGPKIQGNLYKLTEHALVAFDVLVNDSVFLPQDAVDEYAQLLGIGRAERIPLDGGCDDECCETVWEGHAEDWLELLVRDGFPSLINEETQAEGLILRPLTELRTQHGERVQIKLKTRDYKGE